MVRKFGHFTWWDKGDAQDPVMQSCIETVGLTDYGMIEGMVRHGL